MMFQIEFTESELNLEYQFTLAFGGTNQFAGQQTGLYSHEFVETPMDRLYFKR